MVHQPEIPLQNPQMKPSSATAARPQIRRKRLSEPRPHPSHCLNKRFWDDVRAGRLQTKNPNSPLQQMNVEETEDKNERAKERATSSNTDAPVPPQNLTPQNTESSVNNRVPMAVNPPTSTPFFQFPPGFGPAYGMHPPPGISAHTPGNFWPYMPAAHYQVPPGFIPMVPHPYMMPGCFQPPMGFRPEHRQQPPNTPVRQSTSPASTQENQQPMNMMPPQIQFVPIPVPIPIPLSTEFVLKHFGKKM